MDWFVVCSVLVSERLLSWDDMDTVKAEKTSRERRFMLINIVRSKPKKVCRKMLDLFDSHEKAVEQSFERVHGDQTQRIIQLLMEESKLNCSLHVYYAIPLS